MSEDRQEAAKIIADAIYRLGNADASTPMGGLEALGAAILEASERSGLDEEQVIYLCGSLDGQSRAIDSMASSIKQAGEDVGEGLRAIARTIEGRDES